MEHSEKPNDLPGMTLEFTRIGKNMLHPIFNIASDLDGGNVGSL
jgi:hypothetical protein